MRQNLDSTATAHVQGPCTGPARSSIDETQRVHPNAQDRVKGALRPCQVEADGGAFARVVSSRWGPEDTNDQMPH